MQDIKNSNIIKGDELWLFLGVRENNATGATNFYPVAFSNQHSLTHGMSTQSVSSKYHADAAAIIPGEKTWTCTTEALMSLSGNPVSGATGAAATQDYGFDQIYDAYVKDKIVDVQFGKLYGQFSGATGAYNPEGCVENDVPIWQLDPDTVYEGKGYITNLQESANHGDSATMSIEISGLGLLTKKN